MEVCWELSVGLSLWISKLTWMRRSEEMSLRKWMTLKRTAYTQPSGQYYLGFTVSNIANTTFYITTQCYTERFISLQCTTLCSDIKYCVFYHNTV